MTTYKIIKLNKSVNISNIHKTINPHMNLSNKKSLTHPKIFLKKVSHVNQI